MKQHIFYYRHLARDTSSQLVKLQKHEDFKQIIALYVDLIDALTANNYDGVTAEEWRRELTKPCSLLPKASSGNISQKNGYAPTHFQSLESYFQGIKEKTHRFSGSDLSVRQLGGIEKAIDIMANEFNLPPIKFANIETKNDVKPLQRRLFKEAA